MKGLDILVRFTNKSFLSHLDEDGKDDGFRGKRDVTFITGAGQMGLDDGAVLVVSVGAGLGCR